MPVIHPGDNPPPPPPAQKAPVRTKQTRPRSPVSAATAGAEDAGAGAAAESRQGPPPKRARKAINCEPCRNSKLKCDRNRPCSSCVLRGTTAACYQGNDGDPAGRGDDALRAAIDPALEFSRIRQSLSLLESHIYHGGQPRGPLPPSTSAPTLNSAPTRTALAPLPPYHEYPISPRHATDNGRPPDKAQRNGSPGITSTPGMLGQQSYGGLYAGPTSAASHLITASERDESDGTDHAHTPTDAPSPSVGFSSESGGHASSSTSSGAAYDHDLVALLPPVHTIDGLIQYYFEYCNWIYRHVNEPALLAAWARFKGGQSGDRIVLATVCILIALAVRYLPPGHALLASLPGTADELGAKYYGIMRTALRRHREDTDGLAGTYTLELVELLLVRCHYLTFAKEDPEETWSVRGELVSIGSAMGLHRDPGKSRFDRAVAERRRWAWWHIILLERWQAFMFGRPLSIASHHFNTQLPSYCDPTLDKSGRLYLPNIALFRLAYILGDIMDDAVSFRAVPYSAVQDKDKMLAQWHEALPMELDLDEYRIARSLASPITSVRRLGVQSVIIRTAYHHIRFTLHRPYAKIPQSLEIAVSAAGQLIALVGQTRPDFLSNTALAVPGHMNWGPFHVFSAAMFFSFQLITHPDQPAASLFRENIRKAMASLEQSRWMSVADKALTILQAVAPLYSDELLEDPPEGCERNKAQVLSLVKTLAFPYQNSPYSRSADSPGYRRLQESASLPTMPARMPPEVSAPQDPQMQSQMPVSSVRWQPPPSERSAVSYGHQQPPHPPPPPPQHHPHPAHSQSQAIHQLSQVSPTAPSPTSPNPLMTMAYYASQQAATMQQPLPQHAHYFSDGQTPAYMHPADESSMWGASIGFGLGEWTQFLDVIQRPDSARGTGAHAQ
ncbi:hypothetical protein OBBRIDRAFT_798467 [Obba rivulosa]|uniref:Zn(2)-C6 fungal-type domain-containing protein n=1 Tax=Obba rivulosa TaxID=1052685 RepID=A0A8E2DGT1_9APHY|nr:hypothetical protein OBBRIDRAFT_798467 [Obba rivulosa]